MCVKGECVCVYVCLMGLYNPGLCATVEHKSELARMSGAEATKAVILPSQSVILFLIPLKSTN